MLVNEDDKKYGFDGINDMADSEDTPLKNPVQQQTSVKVDDVSISNYHVLEPNRKQHKESVGKPHIVNHNADMNPSKKVLFSKLRNKVSYLWAIVIVALLVGYMLMPLQNEKSGKKYSNQGATSSAEVPSLSESKPDKKVIFEKPPYGSNHVLNMAQLHWCIREEIRIETMRPLINNNKSISEFNEMVEDFNDRCGSFRYRRGDLERARNDVEKIRADIEMEAEEDAEKWGWTEPEDEEYESKDITHLDSSLDIPEVNSESSSPDTTYLPGRVIPERTIPARTIPARNVPGYGELPAVELPEVTLPEVELPPFEIPNYK